MKVEKKEEIAAAIKEHIDDVEGEGPPVFVRGLTEQIVKDGDKVTLEVEISGKCAVNKTFNFSGSNFDTTSEVAKWEVPVTSC